MRFDTVTQFDPADKEVLHLTPIKDMLIGHYADVESRETKCGLEIETYPDGWIWGGKVNCEECLNA